MPRGSLLGRRWIVEPAPDAELVTRLSAGLAVPPAFARILALRGCATVEDARRFLRPSRHDIHEPGLLPDLAAAVERLVGAVRRGEPVLVHGDYDVDGQCAAAIMTRVLAKAGGRPVPFLPNRMRDGYDLSSAGVEAARRSGCRVILTLDCGTTAVEPIRDARALGMDVIIVDHHLPGPERPDALAMVNPRRPESEYPFPDLCGAGVAWKLALALAPELGLPDGYPWHLLDLAALATVADLVPLTGENRAIVRLGLKLMRDTRWPGLAALLRTAGLTNKTVRASHMGFMVGPRLNAAGRVGDASDGLLLLLTDDPGEADRLAAQLDRQNEERQALDQRVLDEALKDLDAWYDPGRDVGVVLARDGWHPGVIGIVASRVVERISRPAFLIAMDGDVGKGSGRSVSRCNLHAALLKCSGLLEKWGGHRMAAGLTLSRKNLEQFREAFNEACKEQLSEEDLVPTQRVDTVLPLADLSGELERLLRALEPTGLGNPGPVFGLEDVRVVGAPRVMGEEHVRLTLSDGERRLSTVAWRLREEVEQVIGESPATVRAAIRLERDTWMGRDLLEGRLVSLSAS